MKRAARIAPFVFVKTCKITRFTLIGFAVDFGKLFKKNQTSFNKWASALNAKNEFFFFFLTRPNAKILFKSSTIVFQ